MRRVFSRGWLVLLLAATPAAGAKTDRPRIDALQLLREAGTVRVSFRVADGLSPEILERIDAGIPVSFRHRVDIVARRAVPLWPAKVLARLRVDTRVAYDSLNRRYDLSRRYDVRRPKTAGADEQLESTESVEVMRAWMTELTELPALELPALEHEGRVRVRVESTLGRRYMMWLFPTRVTVSAERRLVP